MIYHHYTFPGCNNKCGLGQQSGEFAQYAELIIEQLKRNRIEAKYSLSSKNLF